MKVRKGVEMQENVAVRDFWLENHESESITRERMARIIKLSSSVMENVQFVPERDYKSMANKGSMEVKEP